MEIGDAPAALKKVREFITVLERGQGAWSKRSTVPQIWDQHKSQILERLPLILQIAARADAELLPKLKEETHGWPFHRTLEASRQLAGLLESAEEAEQILGPVGPKLAAANLHPWIWNAAANLWDDGTGEKPFRPQHKPCSTATFRRSWGCPVASPRRT